MRHTNLRFKEAFAMKDVSENYSKIKLKSIVFEVLPALVLIVLEREKKRNPRKPMLAAYRIVEEITTDYFMCFDDENSDDEKKKFKEIEKLLRPRIYNIMKVFNEFDGGDDADSKTFTHLGYVKRVDMEYEITEKGKKALADYILLIGNFIHPFNSSVSTSEK